jgi:hypothetical protein
MDARLQSRVTRMAQRLPFEVVALVLQGGGALGAYQTGVYEALSELASIQTGSPAFRRGHHCGQSVGRSG